MPASPPAGQSVVNPDRFIPKTYTAKTFRREFSVYQCHLPLAQLSSFVYQFLLSIPCLTRFKAMDQVIQTVLVASATWLLLTCVALLVAPKLQRCRRNRARGRALTAGCAPVASVIYHTKHGECFHSSRNCDAIRLLQVSQKRPCKLCVKGIKQD